MKVHVAFNDLIETHPLIALSKFFIMEKIRRSQIFA